MRIRKSVVLAVLITYLVLYISAVYEGPPYTTLIEKPATALRASLYTYGLQDLAYPGVYWGVPRDQRKGVVTHNASTSFSGLTFFSTSRDHSAYLVDMEGNIVHTWSIAHQEVWPDPTFVARIVPEHLRLMTRAYLYPNGDVLAQFTGVGSNPLGYGLVKIDKDSKVLWSYDAAVHHDMEVADDGTIYTLSHQVRTESYPGLDKRKTILPAYEDYLVVLSDDGSLRKEVSFFDLLADGPAANMLGQLNGVYKGETPEGDMIHPNGLEIIGAGLAEAHPMLQEGDLLVSFRNLSMLAVIDPDEEKITWAAFLPTRSQHDPRILPDGTVLLFDNEGHVGPGGNSRIVRLDLNTSEILWEYAGSEEKPLYSQYHGSVDPLSNGNVLITESLQGRLLEVTTDGEIVWEYLAPWRAMDNETEVVPALYRARRYTTEELAFVE